MTLKLTIMGCGNSAGVPALGNRWGHCDPDEPRNVRTRPSIAVQSVDTTMVVDTGADFRIQANQTSLEKIDGVIYTHAHSDHINGIDELRVQRQRTGEIVHIYGNQPTLDEIRQRFDYLFYTQNDIYPKVLQPHVLTEKDFHRPFQIGDISFVPFEQDHGTMMSLGLRFGDTAYSTDMKHIDGKAVETLKGIRTWILDGAGYKMPKNLVHCTLKDVYAWNEIIGAERVIITHLTPGMDYETMRRELKEGFEPAYDGMEVEIAV